MPFFSKYKVKKMISYYGVPLYWVYRRRNFIFWDIVNFCPLHNRLEAQSCIEFDSSRFNNRKFW
jgi:hypothetical protein